MFRNMVIHTLNAGHARGGLMKEIFQTAKKQLHSFLRCSRLDIFLFVSGFFAAFATVNLFASNTYVSLMLPLSLVFWRLFRAALLAFRKLGEKTKLFHIGIVLLSTYFALTICAHGRSSALFTSLFSFRPLALGLELLQLGGIGLLCFFSLLWLAAAWLKIEARAATGELNHFSPSKRYFFVLWGGVFLVWLVFYFCEYPGIFTSDTVSQLLQATGQAPLSNWHPVVHTMFIRLTVDVIGRGSLLPYMLLQMATLSAVVAYALWWIYTRSHANGALWVAQSVLRCTLCSQSCLSP
jgi:hypothetical protein